MKLFRKQTRQECINEISALIYGTLLNSGLTESEKSEVLNNVKQRYLENLNDKQSDVLTAIEKLK